MTHLEIEIREMMSDLSVTEQKVAGFVLENLEDTLRLPIGELSERSGVSQASWVRFSKSMGFSGFKELKNAIVIELSNTVAENQAQLNGEFSDIKNKNTLSGICAMIAGNSIQSIQDTIALLEYSTLDEVATAILEAKSVRIFGVGASAVVAEDLCYKLLRIGINVQMFKDFHISLTSAATMTSQDVAIFISHSGRTNEIIELMGIAKQCGTTTVGITKYGKNRLSANCDYVLYTSTAEVEKRSGAMSSRIAQLLLVDVLFTVIGSKDYEHIENKLEQSYRYSLKHRQSNHSVVYDAEE